MVKTILISNQNYLESGLIFNAFPEAQVGQETIKSADLVWEKIETDVETPSWIKMTVEFKGGKFSLLDHSFFPGTRESISNLMGINYVHLNGYI